jgi:forkhead box protein J2/3
MSLQPLPPLMGGTPDHPGDLSQTGSYYPQEPNDLTGGLPINLDSLRDGPPGSKPFYPYSTLIRYVLHVMAVVLRELIVAKQVRHQRVPKPKIAA